jgi:hypothetical protein
MRSAWATLLRLVRRHGNFTVRITSVKRSTAQQAALYRKQGAQGLAAPPGQSKHEYGRALDAVFTGPYDLESGTADEENSIPGMYWEQLGGRWGGRFKSNDWVHFEDPWPL